MVEKRETPQFRGVAQDLWRKKGFGSPIVVSIMCGNVIDHRAARITGGHLFFGVLRIQPPSNKMPS